MRRKLYFAATILALVVGAYAAAGFWLAPRLLEQRLVEAVAGAGHELRIQRLRTNPFRLSSRFEGIELLRRDGTPLLTLQRGEASADLASLWRRVWHVQAVSLDGLRGHLSVEPDGRLNWAEFLAALPQGKAKEPPRLVIEKLSIADGALLYTDRARTAPAELRVEPIDVQLTDLATVADRAGQYVLTASVVGGGSLKWQGSVTLQPLVVDGRLELARLPGEVIGRLSGLGSASPRGAFQASARVAFHGEQRELRVSEPRLNAQGFALRAGQTTVKAAAIELESDTVRLQFQPLRIEAGAVFGQAAGVAVDDPRLRQAAALQMPSMAVKLEKPAWPASAPMHLSASAQARPAGRLQAAGTIALDPITVRLALHAAELPLALAQPWLSDIAEVEIASGVLGLRGTVLYRRTPNAQAPRFSYAGAATLADVALNAAKTGQPLAAWKLLDTADLALRLAPNGLEAGEVLLREPYGRLLVGEDRTVNLAAVKASGKRAAEARAAEEERFPVRVRRVRLEKGRLDFADRSLSPPFSARIDELYGAVSGLSTDRQAAARLVLDGRVERYGAARIRGTINPFSPRSLANVGMNFRNLEMRAFTPYAAKFAGYRIDSGRLSAELRYLVRDGELTGQNHLVIDRLQLGERVESPSARDLPLEMAIAVLTDPNGRIELGLPVHGNLHDPKFDLRELVGRVFANLVGKIASAPFRLLGSLFAGRAEGLERIVFDPGSARLAPPEREKVAAVAKALAERPRLMLSVHGAFDPRSDAQALRRSALRRELARRAGYKAGADDDVSELDLRDMRVRHAAGSYFIEQGGTAFQLRELEGNELFRALADKMPIAEGALEQLARARAEAVRRALMESGADRGRVVLAEPAPAEAARDGVPVTFAVSAR